QAAAALGIGAVGAHAVEALERELVRDLGVLRHERLVARLDGAQLEAQTLGVVEHERVAGHGHVHALAREPLLPEGERLVRAHPEDDPVHHPGARAPARRAGIFEEGDVRARRALLVRVEQVVDGRVVLVDRLLHHPETENARVEVDVARGVPGDAGHVVDAFELHWSLLRSGRDSSDDTAARQSRKRRASSPATAKPATAIAAAPKANTVCTRRKSSARADGRMATIAASATSARTAETPRSARLRSREIAGRRRRLPGSPTARQRSAATAAPVQAAATR